MHDDENKSREELLAELRYFREIAESYDASDSKSIDFGLNKMDALNVLHNIIENVPSHVYAKDRSHRFIMCSNSTARDLGQRRVTDVLGKTDLDLHPEERALEYMADEKKILETGEPMVSKVEKVLGPDGEERWSFTTKVPLRSSAGSIIGILGVSQDITRIKQLEDERDGVIEDLRLALSRIKTLKGLLPICSSCKKIRDDEGYWHRVEQYIHDNSAASFTHGICPVCAEEMYGEFGIKQKKDSSDE